jgi:predicted urease superfamily metal-dependent hydrolase
MSATHARLPGSHQVIPPSTERIMTLTGFHHYDTEFGRIDVCKESGGHTYESLEDGAVAVRLHEHHFFVANLTTVAAMKEDAGREKDKAVLPAIRRRIAEMDSAAGND